MFGKQPGTLLSVQLVDIHGSRFYDLAWTLDSTSQQRGTGRIGVESVYAEPQADDKVLLHLVLGQVTRVEKREA